MFQELLLLLLLQRQQKADVADAMSPPSVQEENWLEKATKPAATYTNKATKC